MLGRILNSLAYQTKKEQKNWILTNSFRREYQYNFFEKLFIYLSRRPLKNLVLILIVFTLLPFVLYYIDKYFISYLNNSVRNEDFQNYINKIWSIQSTLVALVYPIVIGFISLFMKNRDTSKIIIRSFLFDSSAIFMGLSSVMLVLFIGIQYTFLSYIPIQYTGSLMLTNSLWFIINTLGTAWFLYRTIKFIKPDIRDYNLKKYLINEVYTNEIEILLKQHLFRNALLFKWLPEIQVDSKEKNEYPSIILHPIFDDLGEPEIIKSFRFEKRLDNVWFNLLKWACGIWLFRAKRKYKKKNKVEHDIFDIIEQESLIFPLSPGFIYKNDIFICRKLGLTKLTKLEKFLINKSFRFKKNIEIEKCINTHDFLAGFQTELINILNSGHINIFEDNLDLFMELHILLINSGSFKTQSNNLDNYANIDSNIYYGERLCTIWDRMYIDIFDAAAYKLDDSPKFFLATTYRIKRLYDMTLKTAKINMSHNFIKLNFWLWLSLREWWIKSIENQGINNHDMDNPSLLSKPKDSIYEESVISFIGFWERFIEYSEFDSKMINKIKWENLHVTSSYFEQHLNYTVLMAMRTIYSGDKFAAYLLIDVLQRWWSQKSLNFDFDYLYLQRPQLYTLNTLLISEEKAIEKLNQENLITQDEPKFETLFVNCVHNYWKDITCVTLYVLAL